jgi:para-nitrobenzyl esterase
MTTGDGATTTRSGPVVSTAAGPVQGLQLDGVELYIEIPYAASPTGPNRFKPPVAPTPWREARACQAWTTRAPQNPDEAIGRTPRQWYSIQGGYYAPDMDEDCLRLNVWTPASDGGRRPVLVWVHGGGYTHGHAVSEMSDGENFARKHDVVFVSITHRINAFGFLQLEDLAGPQYSQSGNVGLLDLIAGLEWIRDNIEAFGGDPHSVTVAGESGGGAKISTLLTMSDSAGLLHRAMCQSGVALTAWTREEGTAYAAALISQLGGTEIDVLLSASTHDLLDAQLAVENALPDLGSPRPVVDGRCLEAEPLKIWSSGGGADVPVLAGTIHDEVTVFGSADLDISVDLPSSYHHGVGKGKRSPLAAESLTDVQAAMETDISSLYNLSRGGGVEPDNERRIAQDLMTQWIFRYPAVRFAEARADSGRPTYLYRFDWASLLLGQLGACHSTSVAFFFDNVDKVKFTRGNPDAAALSSQMSASLSAFMRIGSPAAQDVGQWGPYDRQSRQVCIFDTHTRIECDPERAQRVALEGVSARFFM